MKSATKKENHPAWAADWQVGVRVWVERAGKAILGDGRADLLTAIDRTHSISAAARQLGISYRHAWILVHEANTAAGEPLVSAAVGGVKGGGAQLTDRGRLSLEIYDQLRREVRTTAAGLLQRAVTPNVDQAATIHLAAAISLQDVVGQLLTEYALRQPGVRVRAVFGASNELADHVLAGAPCDLFVSADATHLDRLAAAERIVPRSRKTLATNNLVALGARGMRKTVRAPRDLVAGHLGHVALADPACPLGRYSREYLERAGLYDEVVKKAVQVDNSRAILAALESGRAEAALAFGSDAAKATGCEILFAADLPSSAPEYTGAVIHGGTRQKEAEDLLDFFASSSARRCFARCGFSQPKRAGNKKLKSR